MKPKTFSIEILPVQGQNYTFEIKQLTGEMEESNTFEINRFYKDGVRQNIGFMNEKYVHLEKNTILSQQEIKLLSDVMLQIQIPYTSKTKAE